MCAHALYNVIEIRMKMTWNKAVPKETAQYGDTTGLGTSQAVCSALLSKFKTRVELTEIKHASDPPSQLVLQQTDVLVAEPGFILQSLEHLKSVKWVHCVWAGVNELIGQPTPPSFILTRHVGSYGQLMSEYVIAQMVNRERKHFEVYQNQLRSKWCLDPTPPRMLSQLSIGILGVGEIGSKLAEFCKAFGMTVWGLSRTNSNKCLHVDHHKLQDGLSELLENCDYVCNVLPSTPNTRGLLNGDVLKACEKKKSVFINIGRGDVVSEDTIITAIRNQWLSGAILDVFEKEPLPEDSELWKMPEVTVTPHMSGPAVNDAITEVFLTNLELYLEGKEMKYVVDWTRGY